MIERTISEEEIVSLVEEVKPYAERYRKGIEFGVLSFFEVYTAIAFLFFARMRVDIAVLEVGMGGRLDATNVVEPLVCAITSISFDHVDKLGRTLRAISTEKAGIIKEDCLVVSAPQEKESMKAIEEICHRRGAELYIVGKDISFSFVSQDYSKQVLNISGMYGVYPRLEIPLLGYHQMENASVAVGVVELLRNGGINVTPVNIRDGLRKTNWPGRLEILREKPLIVVDGAHNPGSAKALKEAARAIFSYERLILILGTSDDKDIAGIGEQLCPSVDEVIITKANVPRAAEPELVAKQIGRFCRKMTLTISVGEAIDKALTMCSERDMILITGSLYVVGEALQVFAKTR
jgi:dihydrofolate synthase/folylpolyglutamate synthase